MKTLPLLAVVATISLATARAADWPGYRGANQDSISTETLKLPWPADGPRVVWKVPMNTGFSSFAVGGGKVFTQVVRDINGAPREICLALDAGTGKELWIADLAVGKGYSGGGNGDGPRSTPAVSDGMVYVSTPDLVLRALHAGTGKPLWTVNLIRDHAGRNIGWNNAASPVVDGDLVFIAGGGSGQSLLAINKKTGKVAWKTGDETITHATPVVATILGERQVIYFCKSGLVAVAAKDGRPLWKFPYSFKTATAATPVIGGDIVFCSAGYGVGGGACRISKTGNAFTATPLYQIPGNKDIATLWSTPLYKNGHLYGIFSYKSPGRGPLKCVDAATGTVNWEQPGFGDGQVILVGDKLLALSDKGELVVVEAAPTAYKEIARTKAVDGKCWSTPAFSNGRIYVRSTTEGVCLDPTGK